VHITTRSLRRNSQALEDEPPIPPLGERPGNGQGGSFFLPFLRPLGFWSIRTEGLALFTEAGFSERRLYGVLGSALRKDLLQLYLLSREPFTLWQGCYLPPH
jgi:hypothetical protein